MVDLPLREERNQLRGVVISAAQNETITKEEAGFVLALVERFRSDIVKKERQATLLAGEISQLRANEQIIVQLIDNMVSASERYIARRETSQKLIEGRIVQEEKIREMKDQLNSTPVEEKDPQLGEEPAAVQPVEQ
jgi:hypothetical protein